jgi:hypothetical protein
MRGKSNWPDGTAALRPELDQSGAILRNFSERS